ncbi:Apoptosis-inducing factor 2 [Smittium culicis]|uniref:Apoptosis-inducing factor 2 n=1 Tax=Smittium culicis TaxID=133412 RepID=A0A1R1Y048_9FUNG|nr:Apoptosis-inducing factor 2 [Smittium culicis]
MTSSKTVVIIGASFAGLSAFNKFQEQSKKSPGKIKAILIEKHSHFNHIPEFSEGIVNPDFTEKIFIPYTSLIQKGDNDNSIIQDEVKSVFKDKVALKSGKEIKFDYLIIATGQESNGPARLKFQNKEDGVQAFKDLNSEIVKSKRILVIGGGIVGAEVSSHIAATYPDKEVTIVHTNKDLLSEDYSKKVINKLKAKLTKLRIKFIFNERISADINTPLLELKSRERTLTTNNGNDIVTDLPILCAGGRPITDFMETIVPSDPSTQPILDFRTGAIRVNSRLQLEDKAYPNIFAVGDCNNLPRNNKYASIAMEQAEHVATNLIKLINNPNVSLTEFKTPKDIFMIKTAKGTGIGYVNGFVPPSFLIGLAIRNNLFLKMIAGKLNVKNWI